MKRCYIPGAFAHNQKCVVETATSPPFPNNLIGWLIVDWWLSLQAFAHNPDA